MQAVLVRACAFLVGLLLLIGGSSWAAEARTSRAEDRLRAEAKTPLLITRDPGRPNDFSVSGKVPVPGDPPTSRGPDAAVKQALRFLGAHQEVFELRDVRAEIRDGDARNHGSSVSVRLARYYNGHPVFASGIAVHLDPALTTVTYVTATLPQDLSGVPAEPRITKAEATRMAIWTYQGKELAEAPTLVVLDPQLLGAQFDEPTLAWRVNLLLEEEVFVDATNGRVVFSNSPRRTVPFIP